MTAGFQSRSYLLRGVTVPASQTNAEVSRFNIKNGGQLNLKVDLYVGKVTSGGTPKLQDSNGYELWNDAKTGSGLSASTDITVTPDFTTGTFTATAHGLANGTWVALNSTGAIPGGLDPGSRYFVQNATANTFQLSSGQPVASLPVSFSSNGSGTVTVTAVTVATLALNVEVSGDQAVMPLRPNGRVVITTTGGQVVQVMDVRLGQSY